MTHLYPLLDSQFVSTFFEDNVDLVALAEMTILRMLIKAVEASDVCS